MKYSKGFKNSIVRRVVENGTKSVYQVSKDTGITASTINNWIEKHKAGRLGLDSSDDLTPSQRLERNLHCCWKARHWTIAIVVNGSDDRGCTPNTSLCGSRS